MNLWLRLIWLIVTTFFRPRLTGPGDVSTVTMRVLPNDLDVNLHVNNGRYLTLMDLGRMDIFIRSGLLKALRGTGWMPVLSAAKIRFRREMRLFQKFRLETRIVFWAQTTFVMEHRCIRIDKDGESLAAHALMRGGIYDRKARAYVAVDKLFGILGVTQPSPELTDDVRAFLEAEEALKQAQ